MFLIRGHDMGESGGYFSNVNADLLRLLPPDTGTVLEVGCGAGALAEAFRRRNPGVRWYGVEPDEAACKAANTPGRCDFAAWDTVELCDFDDGRFPADPVDVVVAGDVLEHLVDPWGQLERLVALLKPGGLVLACIPNVRHYTMVLRLLKGGWDYEDDGLLDRTHNKFFALETIKAMFRDAGLEIFEIRARQCGYDPAAYADFEGMINPKVMTQELRQQSRCYQWVVRARKPGEWKAVTEGSSGSLTMKIEANAVEPIPPPLRIHAIETELCCGRPRLREPLEAIATIPGVRTSVGWGEPKERPDILIRQRDRHATAETYRAAFEAGILTVAEVDDNPEHLVGMEREDFLALRGVHAVTVSTGPIAEIVRPHNPHVFVVPNQVVEVPPLRERRPLAPGIPYSEEAECPKTKDPDVAPVRIFCGWQNRREAWGPILPALNRVLADHDASVEVVNDREFFEAIETRKKRFHPFLEYPAYRRLLATCDIAILPLADSPIDRCKSDVKAIECFAEGVAVLASDVVYRPVCDASGRGILGWHYRTPEDFEHYLRRLIREPGIRVSLTENAHRYVAARRMLKDHYRATHDLYRSLLARKAELDAALLARCPEMAQAASLSS